MVLIDGKPELLLRARGRRASPAAPITTVEGLSRNGALHPLQQAFLDEQAGQCGYCLSGILISAAALLAQQPQAKPRRDRRGARSASLPLRHAQPRHPRRAEGRRRHGGGAPMIANTLPQSLIDNPLLSQWIAFENKDRVRVGSGKVEIGQGILTALTQIAAEELDVRPEQVQLVSGQTDVSPAEGFTSGSYSIAVGGASIRLVCAEVRALFLDRAGGNARLHRSASFRSRTENSCAPARTPAATTGRSRARSRSNAAPAAPRRSSGRRPIASSAATCRGSTCRRRSRARPSSTTSRPRTSCTRACCASPGAARVSPRSTRRPCARPPRRRSTFCARAISSPSPPRARSP